MEENNIIMLEDENGNPVECVVIDVFELNGDIYFAMIEADDAESDAEETDVIIMKRLGEDEEATLIMIDDDYELEAAFDEFVKRDSDDEDFE